MEKATISGGRTLSEDIIECRVLPLLPAKTLIRLQCVSKRWRALISTDPHFMRLQDAHARSSPALLLFGETPCPVFLPRREERDPPRSIGFPRLFRQPLFGSPLGNWLPLAACRGILCIAVASSSDRTSGLYLGNPVWMDWRPLPAPPLPGWTPDFNTPKMHLAVHDTPGGTHYKLVLPFPTRSGIARRAEAAFLVFSSTKGSWEISQQKVLVKLLDSRDLMVGFIHSVCVEGVFFWLARLEVLWFDPRDERGGAIPLPFTDEAQLPRNIGEWEGKLSFATLVDGEIRMWSWNRSSWFSRTLFTMETAAKADPDFFTSIGLGMNLRNRSAESLESVLSRTRPSIAVFGAGCIVFMFKPRAGVCFRGLCYDAATGKAWKLKRVMDGGEGLTTPFAYANSLLKLTTP